MIDIYKAEKERKIERAREIEKTELEYRQD